MEMLRLSTVRLYRRGGCLSLQCCSTLRKRDSEKKPKPTPLPWGKLMLICSVIFVNQFGINLIFPFLPYMIHDFFPELDRTQIGQKAGYLGCAYYVGNFMGSLIWGWISDVVGRRPALLWGMCGIIFSEVLFAFSQTFGWAVAARFLWGALNGNIGIGKTYISDICDDTNQARGFAMVGVTRGIGQLLGSLLGGFLSQPASKYPALQLPVFCQYPYSLPVLLGALMGVFSLTSSWLFLDETLNKKKKRSKSSEDLDSSTPSQVDSSIDLVSTDPAPESDTEMIDLLRDGESEDRTSDQPLLMAESDVDTDDCELERVNSDTELLVRERQSRRKWPRPPSCNPLFPCIKLKERVVDCMATPVAMCRYLKNSRQRGSWSPRKALTKETVSRRARLVCEGVKRRALLMVDRRVFFSTMLYGLFAFIGVMSLELIPLLLVTSHKDGGFSFDDNELGVIFMVSAVLQLLYHLLMFSRVTKLLGFRNTFRLGVFLFGVTAFLLPFSNQITGPIPSSNSSLPYNDTAGSGMSPDDETSGYCNYTLSVNSSFESSVNVNSVTRVPIYVWFVVISIITVAIIGRITSVTATMILINNSSLPATKGMINGIGQALAAIGRSIGPALGAPVFAWSESTGLGWPLNFHFVFELMLISSVVIFIISFFLPKSIECKRESPPFKTAPPSETDNIDNSPLPTTESSEELGSSPVTSSSTSDGSTVPPQDVSFISEPPTRADVSSDLSTVGEDTAHDQTVSSLAETASVHTSEMSKENSESDYNRSTIRT